MSNLSEVTSDFIADLSNQAIIALSKDGRIVFFNTQARLLFENLHTSCNLNDIVVGDDKVFILHNINLAFYQHNDLDFYWLYRKRVYWVSARLNKHILFMNFNDITEIRRQSELLHQSSQRLEQIENLAKIGYWELNSAQKVFYWSDGMYELFALDNKTKSYHYNLLRRYIHSEDIDLYRKKLRDLIINKQHIDGNIRIIDALGSIKQCRFSAMPIYLNGDEGACGILQDITDYCRSSDKLTIASLGHDIKNHLQIIRLYSDSLINNSDNNNYASKIAFQIEKITLLLNNASDLARGDSRPIMHPIDLKAVLQEVCQEFQSVAQAKNILLTCRLQEVNLISNQALLSSILRNLLDNAFKFAHRKVILGNNADSVWVIDDGCGISSEAQSRIFERFYQDSKQSGWGLGLYTVKENSRRLGAKLSFKSRLNHYTIFKLNLLTKESLPKSKICVNKESLLN